MANASKVDSNLRINKQNLNSVFGKIDSLYQENDNNLVEVKIQENDSGTIITFTASSDTNLDSSTIKIVNLNDFCSSLEEACNKQSLVSIFHEDDKLVLLEITKQVFIARGGGGQGSGGGSGGSGGTGGGSGGSGGGG